MSFTSKETIAALATAPLSAGVAVIRISGPKAFKAAKSLFPSLDKAAPKRMIYGPVKTLNGDNIDHGLAVYFKAPASFTGEDVVEIHCHGGRAIVQEILDNLTSVDGVCQAEAGEFSRRAFLNGKMDLVEAEGLADLIAAETKVQRQQALRQLEGELGNRFESWRQQVMHLLAHVEAAIDFPDEELEVLEEAGLKAKLEKLIYDLETAIQSNIGERVRQGFSVVILGRPNAGKSTLINLLSGQETAIVSPFAGTTRDVVETHLDIGGFPVVLADTAGLRETEDVIEKEGVRRAAEKAKGADLAVVVVDAGEWPALDKAIEPVLKTVPSLIVVSKVDQHADSQVADKENIPVLACDLTQPATLDTILPALKDILQKEYQQAREGALVTRGRHRACIQNALKHLKRARELYMQKSEVSLSDLLAQDLRDVAREIGNVTGRTDSEAVLDVVFSTFCIGK